MANAVHDDNRVKTLLATSSSDGTTPVVLWADPTTHRLLVDMAADLGDLDDVTITSGAKGDILYRNATNDAWINLGVGSNGQVLTLASGVPTWANAGAGDVTAASSFGTDNVLIRSDGTGKGVQASGIGIDDSDNMTGLGTLNTHTLPGGTSTLLIATDIGSSIQAYDEHLDSIAGLTPGTEGSMITSDGLGGYQISAPSDVRSYLNVEDGATADQSDAEIKTAYENNADTNAYTDAEQTKLGYISVTQAVNLDQMETDIAALANGMVYKGDWDASAGTFPGGGTAQIGAFYYVSVAGTVDGIDFAVGDNIVAIADNASTTTYASNWSKHDQTDAVQSVVGLTGSITKSSLLTALNVADGATANSSDATLLNRANHTGTQTAATISDFDTEVANNTAVTANTAKVSYPEATSSTDLSVANGGTGASTAAGAFSNLKQAATTSATGVVELATTAEVNTGTDTSRAITPDALAGSNLGIRYIQILVTAPDGDTSTGNGKAYVHIPAGLNGMNLVEVHAEVVTAPTGSAETYQIHNVTQAADMLSTALTIDATETGSDTAATPAVIDTANDDVSTNDVIRIDIDGVGSTTAAQGLILTMGFQLP